MINPSTLNVLFMASEADPLIKVGGLGDVAGSLPHALKTVGSSISHTASTLDIRLVLPFHPAIQADKYAIRQVASYTVQTTAAEIGVEAFELELDGLAVYLINGTPIEHESGVYSTNLRADAYKYVFFSQAALNLPKRIGWKPDILHANDWHTSAAVYSLALNRPIDPFFRQTASVLTVHNLPYLGSMSSEALTAFELPPAEHTSLPSWASHMALPLGLLTADSIVAVSPGYSKEILTDKFGSGLQNFLRAHAEKITGILNGLDTNRWNPATDGALIANYSSVNLQDRSANKATLQGELGLGIDPHIPILSMVTRMDPQKGVDLAVEALRMLLQPAAKVIPSFQVVILGTGEPVLEQSVLQLEHENPDKVRALITYNEKLSRLIYAGADILLMPSRYEPCGLSQMIAMHYGCIPVARATGGLIDTIQDPQDSEQGTGFLFKPARSEALVEVIRRAVVVYVKSPEEWKEMQLRGMQQDFSWDKSAMEYLEQYKKLLDTRSESRKYV